MSELALPEGWVGTKLGSYIYLKNGYAFKSSEYLPQDIEHIPLIRIGDIQGNTVLMANSVFVKVNEQAESFVINKSDLLIAMSGATTGKMGVYREDRKAYQNQRVGNIKLVIPNLGSKSYRNYLIQSLKQTIYDIAYGGAQPNISAKAIESIDINLPPLNEQEVIAQILNDYLTTVSQIQARLDVIPKLIEKFRQSVLNDAVSGRLTEEWRKDKRYQKLDSYEIPTCWTVLSIEDIADVKGGKRLPKGEKLVEFDTGYPYIRAGQLKLGTVVNTDEARSSQKYLLAETQKQIENYIVKENDAYITIVGASIGDAGLIPKSSSGANLTENAAKLTNYKEELNPVFLSFWLRSAWIQHKIRLQIKSGAQGKLALHRIKSLPFVYPTYEEQNKIVQKVEQFFAYADQIEKSVATAKARVDHLTQSILHQAFTGSLTAEWREQNPDLISGDNSAEALLSKIKAEKKKASKA